MAWNDTPQATQRINQSQPLIQANFSNLQTEYSINHVPLQNASDNGKHIKVDITRIGAQPTAAGTDLTFYNFLNTLTSRSEMYVRRNGASGIPFTATSGTTTGWTYLPSGLLVKWGQGNGSGDFTVVNSAAPCFGTNIYSIQLTPITNDVVNNNKTVVLRTMSVNPGVSFTLNVTAVERLSNTAVNTTFYYLAIGI